MMSKPKILIFDIETSPNLGYVWGKWEQNVIEFKEEWHMLSFSAKWLGGKQITKGLCDYPGYKKDKDNDKALVLELHKLFDEADIIVAHNGDQFDIKKTQMRFSFHRISPPSPFKTVDTKKIAKKYFAFNSNSLNDLGLTLGLGKKEKHDGFDTWTGCMAGNKTSWNIMKKYNAEDVLLLEKIYLHFLPWMGGHPNLSQTLGYVCPKCGSDKLHSRGYSASLTGIFNRFQCQDCGGWGRERTKVMDGVTTNVNI